MDDNPERRPTTVTAMCLAQRLVVDRLDLPTPLLRGPLVVRFDADTIGVLFSYGVAVVFGAGEPFDAALKARLDPGLISPFEVPEIESAEIVLGADGRAGSGRIRIQDMEFGRLQVVASVLAKSVVLAHYEKQLSDAIESVEPLAELICAHRVRRPPRRELLRHIGTALLVEARTLGRVEVIEKPEVLWERDDLDSLYDRLSAEYELRERQEGVERKLSVIGRTAETLLSLMHDRHSLRVEWYIVALIVVEIVIMLSQMAWVGGGH